jgi:hypothetical protein
MVIAGVVEAVERLGIWKAAAGKTKIVLIRLVDKWVMKQRCETELIQPCLTPVVGFSGV